MKIDLMPITFTRFMNSKFHCLLSIIMKKTFICVIRRWMVLLFLYHLGVAVVHFVNVLIFSNIRFFFSSNF
jgi:hypothetical protein